MKVGKIWGTTEPLLVTPLVELHRIHVWPDMRSSMHKHERKWNAFYVVHGSIRIVAERNGLTDETTLKRGEMTSIPPGTLHRFEATEEAIVLELYYLEPLSEDIVRSDKGGEL